MTKKNGRKSNNFHPNGLKSKKIKGLQDDLKNLKDLSDPKIIEKIAAKMMSAQNEVNSEDVTATVERYLNKSVLVNPIEPNDNLHTTVSIPTAQAIGSVAVVDKPYVYGIVSSLVGPTQFRIINPFNAINGQFSSTGKIFCSVVNSMVTQEDILPFVRAFVFKNPFESNRLFEIYQYKKYQEKYQYSIIADIDDYSFEYPEWHPEHGKFTIENARTLLINLKTVDQIIVSTETLKEQLIDLGIETPIVVVPNHLPRSYVTDVRRYRLKDISKPKILYNGSNYHYGKSNGDLDGIVKDFILKNLENYEFTFMGIGRRADGSLTLPDYLQEPAKNGLIKITPFYTASEYQVALRQLRPDYVLGPLVECPFNEAKSDLRFLEATASGALFIGSRFENGKSPYQNYPFSYGESEGVAKIEEIIETTSNREVFNDYLKSAYDILDKRWIDSTANLLNYIKIFGDGIRGVQITPEHEQYEDMKNYLDDNGFLR